MKVLITIISVLFLIGCHQDKVNSFTGNQEVALIHQEHQACMKKAKTDKEKNLCVISFCERVKKTSIDMYENIACQASPAL